MSAVEVVQNGSRVSMPYRQAVGLVARGLASWYEPEATPPVKVRRAPQKVWTKPLATPQKPVEPAVKPSQSETVSSPTPGAEAALTGYEPSPPDL